MRNHWAILHLDGLIDIGPGFGFTRGNQDPAEDAHQNKYPLQYDFFDVDCHIILFDSKISSAVGDF